MSKVAQTLPISQEAAEKDNKYLKAKFLLLKKNYRLVSAHYELLRKDLKSVDDEHDSLDNEMQKLLQDLGYSEE